MLVCLLGINNMVILCWGTNYWNSTHDGYQTITLPVTYNVPCTIGTAILGDHSSFIGHRHTALTISSFYMNWWGNTNNDRVNGVSYIAIGY